MFSPSPRVNLHYARRISPQIKTAVTVPSRFNSTTPKAKPTPALVQQLRKQTSCSVQKAIQALSSTGNDYAKAIEWLSEDLALSGQKTTTKLAGRTASNGLVAISPLLNGTGKDPICNLRTHLQVGMIELNCETDFVARSEVFEKLARDLAWTVGFYADGAPMIHEPPLAASQGTFAASLSTEEGTTYLTIRSAIANTVTRVGENIIFKRAAFISSPPLPLKSKSTLSAGIYAHNSTAPKDTIGATGTVAGTVLLKLRADNLRQLGLKGGTTGASWREDYRGLERALARQVVGFETAGIKAGAISASPNTGHEEPMPLYAQEFHTYVPLASRNPRYEGLPLDNVGRTLKAWCSASGMEGKAAAVEVSEFLKWRVGEDVD